MLHADHLHATHGVFHFAHIVITSCRAERAVLEHGRHFLLVRRMGGRFAEVELVQHGAVILQHEADGFAVFDLDAFRGEVDIAHFHLDGAVNLCQGAGSTNIVLRVARIGVGDSTGDQGNNGNQGRSALGIIHFEPRKMVWFETPLMLARRSCRQTYAKTTDL
ncbi:hypothetical protein D9M71_438680 [compost metagenome]